MGNFQVALRARTIKTESGQQTFTPAEFAEKYGWKNDPEKVKLAE